MLRSGVVHSWKLSLVQREVANVVVIAVVAVTTGTLVQQVQLVLAVTHWGLGPLSNLQQCRGSQRTHCSDVALST